MSQATSQAMTPPHDNKCLPNIAYTHHSRGPPLFSHAHCTILCLFVHLPTPVLLQATLTTHSSTLPPTITCPSAWLPGHLAHSHLPVHPATHLVCEPYAPLTCGLSQAPSACLPPNGTLLSPHSLPASLMPPPCHLHMTSHYPTPFLLHPAAPRPPMHASPPPLRAPMALLCHTDAPLTRAHPC